MNEWEWKRELFAKAIPKWLCTEWIEIVISNFYSHSFILYGKYSQKQTQRQALHCTQCFKP